MPKSTLEPAGNRLLASLPPEEYERLLPHLEHVSFALGEVVYESGRTPLWKEVMKSPRHALSTFSRWRVVGHLQG